MNYYLPETIQIANDMTERLIEEKVAAGISRGQAQMDAVYEVNQWLLGWRAIGAEI